MGRASIGYINKDYESIRQELLAKIPQLTDRWTDFNHSDLGVVLLDLFCGVGDMLAYYLDAQAAEAFLPTARQRQNVINLCKLIGYRLDSPVASTTTLRLRLSAPLGKDLTIPAGTACRALLNDGEADFETVEDGLLPRGVLSVDIPARQGVRRTETFTATGLPFQRIRLTGDVIAQGTITVTEGDDAWSEVDHFQDSLADSRHFMADLDALDISTLIFGDGQSGAVPAQGSAITVSYLQTIGDQGNLGPNRITQLLSPVYLDGGQVSLTVTNPVPATGGASREALEHARRQAPAELRSLWKAVTLEDYQALAEGYPGVAKAKVLDDEANRNRLGGYGLLGLRAPTLAASNAKLLETAAAGATERLESGEGSLKEVKELGGILQALVGTAAKMCQSEKNNDTAVNEIRVIMSEEVEALSG